MVALEHVVLPSAACWHTHRNTKLIPRMLRVCFERGAQHHFPHKAGSERQPSAAAGSNTTSTSGNLLSEVKQALWTRNMSAKQATTQYDPSAEPATEAVKI